MRRFHLPWSRFPDLRDPEEEAKASPIRWRLWLGIAAALLALLVVAAVWLAPKFERQLAEKSLRQAQEMLRLQDYRRAQLMLEQAVQTNPGDSESRRQLARFYEDIGSPRALPTWRELVRLTPGDDANEIGLALCALRLGDLASAREAASAVSGVGRATVEYHRLAAGIALKAGNQVVLDSEIAELATLEPDNARAQFNHAAVELASAKPILAEAARQELMTLARGKPLRIRATLELMRAAGRDATAYPILAEQILPPRGGLPSYLTWAMVPRGFFDLIVYMQAQPNPEPEDAAILADWLRRQGLAAEAAFWLGTLETATQNDPQVMAVRASCFVQTHDWRSLAGALRQGAWGRVSDDIVNLAMASRLQAERRQAGHARDSWSDALDLAGNSFETLRAMLRLSEEMGWPQQTEATLQRIIKVNPRTPAAWQALAAIAIGAGATERLYEIDNAWVRADPGEPAALASRAWIAAVLGRSTPADAADDKNLSAPAFAAARALKLRAADRGAEALALLDGLPPAAKDDRHVALVRGLLLADRGQRVESEQALGAAAAGPLLPEESLLVQGAHARNRQQ
jgi:tetratricopeptide (TPR) repeat protein